MCSVIQCLTLLPEAIEVKLLRKSKNRTTGEEREEKGKGRAGMKQAFSQNRQTEEREEEEER